jgi:hypothetical protein
VHDRNGELWRVMPMLKISKYCETVQSRNLTCQTMLLLVHLAMACTAHAFLALYFLEPMRQVADGVVVLVCWAQPYVLYL